MARDARHARARTARLTFSGTASQQVTVRMTSNTYGSITVQLLKPDGSQLTSATSSRRASTCRRKRCQPRGPTPSSSTRPARTPELSTSTLRIRNRKAESCHDEHSSSRALVRHRCPCRVRLRIAWERAAGARPAAASGGPDGDAALRRLDPPARRRRSTADGRGRVRPGHAEDARRPGGCVAPRSWHTATVLPDGTVLVAGGVGDDGQIVQDVERFDPATGELAAVTDSSFTPRAHHTATLLTDGRVLFAGGETPGGGGLRAELWDSTNQCVGRRLGSAADRPLRWRGAAPAGWPRSDLLAAAARAVVSPAVVWPNRPTCSIRRCWRSSMRRSPSAWRPCRPTASPRYSPAISPRMCRQDVRVSLRLSTPIDAQSLVVTLEALGSGAPAPLAATMVTAEGGRLVFLTPASALPPDSDVSRDASDRAHRGRTAHCPPSRRCFARRRLLTPPSQRTRPTIDPRMAASRPGVALAEAAAAPGAGRRDGAGGASAAAERPAARRRHARDWRTARCGPIAPGASCCGSDRRRPAGRSC